MAVFADTDSVVTVNSVDLSDHLVSSQINWTVGTARTVAMGATAETVKPTFRSATVSFEFQQDFAASSVDATLSAALGTTVAVTYKHTSAATSATNPEYQGQAVITEYMPADSAAGDIATFSVTWPIDGDLTRAVA